MVKGSYILMENNREQLIQIITSTQVADSLVYNRTREVSPLLAKLMMRKFKQFLVNDNITDIERQTMLLKFLETQNDFDVANDVVKYLQECDLKEDYAEILMEWTYNNSEQIKINLLEQVDGVGLIESKEQFPQLKLTDKTSELGQLPVDDVEAILDDLIQEIINVAIDTTQLPPEDGDYDG